MLDKVNELNKKFENESIENILHYFENETSDKLSFSSSYGAEDQALLDMLMNINSNINVFTLDTGRLHNETYQVIDASNLKYSTKVDVYFPNNTKVEELYKIQGINGIYESIEKRKACCYIRKIEPLKRALTNVDIWITGLRSSQSVTREAMKLFEYDSSFDIIKFNPLINFTSEEIWDYIKRNNVPYNKLHDKGFPSIGCAPCTREVKEGDDIRSGRWWWENPEHKECGLHSK